ncbi:hypothetical protein A1O7_02668 [Cladophialophora yegresii CBS 114405]|uniref:DUF4219 domain-containing protein n=1 Tax=Cladophialophora yegresii CBS 114405 TaxID=1182544 RepID=W9WB63_9EURO|nr:uncharacterized protein A1O7_02668 [Cladophialophora yegresii CBS 114405]EXJ62235.1 hypothetical protein A1O7_02668 [Cladophialophora yegresii CBS 114405]
MSSLSDSDVTVLTANNYVPWARNFRAVAQEKDVWMLFTGDEPILPKPDFEAMLEEATDKDGHAGILFLQITYKMNSVDPVIRYEITGMTPNQAYVYLQETYKFDNVRARKIAEENLANLTFSPSEPAMTFVNKVRILQRDIRDAEGNCTNAMVMYTITRSLPKDRFADFLTSINIIKDMPKAKEVTMSEFMGRLVFAEAVPPKVASSTEG